jgi:hypothetical protein
MSMLGERAAKAQEGIAEIESALERTQRALQAAERVDHAAAEAKRRSGKVVKLLLVLVLLGIAGLAVKKVLAKDETSSGSRPPAGADDGPTVP